MSNIINTRIKEKTDTKSNWETNNPVLLDGELGFASDTYKLKTGKNTTWTNSGYINGTDGAILKDDITTVSDEYNNTGIYIMTHDATVKNVSKVTNIHGLPVEYQEVEYIQNNSSCYIATDITETDDTAVDIKISGTKSGYLYGSTQQNSYVYNGFYSNRLEYNWTGIGYNSADVVEMSQEVVGTSITIKINNQTFVRSTGTANGTKIYLFACNGGSRTCSTGLKVYYFRIKQGGVVVRDYIPCYRKSDNKAGMYDLVTNTFNYGVGTFSVGSNTATESIYFSNEQFIELPQEYQEIDYIKSTGTQYINTELVGHLKEDTVEIKYQIEEPSQNKMILDTTRGVGFPNEWWYNFTYSGNDKFICATQEEGASQSTVQLYTPNDSSTHIIRRDKLTFFLDGVEIGSYPNTVSNDLVYPYQFPSNNYSPVAKLYYMKVIRNNEYILNLIPVVRKSDDVCGFYDLVKRKFYPSEGTDNFNVVNSVTTYTTANRLTSGNNVISSASEAKTLPGGYQEVEYLESTGAQWIDTEKSVSSDLTLSLTAMNMNPTTESTVFGIYYDSAGILLGFASYNVGYYQYTIATSGAWKGANISNSAYHTYKITTTNTYIDDVSTGNTLPLQNINYNCYLFTSNIFGKNGSYRVKSLMMYNSGVLTLNFIPCYRVSDLKPGMYDTVTNTFFVNQGTEADFILGPVVKNKQYNTVSKPSILSFSNDTVTTSAFYSTNISDVHSGTGYKVTTDLKGNNIIYATYDAVNLTSKTITFNKTSGTKYYLFVKYYGKYTGESEWSNPYSFIATSLITTPTLLSPVNNSVLDTNTITAISSTYSSASYTHSSTDWKITYDINGENIHTLVENSNDLTTHTFSNLSLTNGMSYYVWCRYKGTLTGTTIYSSWSSPIKITKSVSGRSLYRHSSNMGTVMEFNDGSQRKVLVLDASYRVTRQFGTYNTDTGLTNYSTTNRNNNWNIDGGINQNIMPENCNNLTDVFLNAMWANSVDAKTAKQNDDVWMTYTGITDDSSIVGVPAVEYCRSITVNGVSCDLPNIQTLMRIYCEAERIDALDPTVSTNPTKALGSSNTNGFWGISNINTALSSTEYSSSKMRVISKTTQEGYDDKNKTLAVIPVLEITD